MRHTEKMRFEINDGTFFLYLGVSYFLKSKIFYIYFFLREREHYGTNSISVGGWEN